MNLYWYRLKQPVREFMTPKIDPNAIMESLELWKEFYENEIPFVVTKDPIGNKSLYDCTVDDLSKAEITFRQEFIGLIESKLMRPMNDDELSELGYGVYFVYKLLQNQGVNDVPV